MEFSEIELQKQFKEYYKKTGNTATHVFVFSEDQSKITFDYLDGNEFFDGKKNYVNGLRYSEMRNRDSDSVFNWEDTKIIAVGTIRDVKRR